MKSYRLFGKDQTNQQNNPNQTSFAYAESMPLLDHKSKTNTLSKTKINKLLKTPSKSLSDKKSSIQKLIFSNLRKQQKQYVIKNYLFHQPMLTSQIRTLILEWCVQSTLLFDLTDNTLYLAVYLIDKYISLSKSIIEPIEMHLLGITALFSASKFEEIYPPTLNDFTKETEMVFTKQKIINTQQKILSSLDFKIPSPPHQSFIHRYLQILTKDKALQKKYQLHVKFLLEIQLYNVEMMQYLPSLKVCATIYLLNYLWKSEKIWTQQLRSESGYSQKQLKLISKQIYVGYLEIRQSNLNFLSQQKFKHKCRSTGYKLQLFSF